MPVAGGPNPPPGWYGYGPPPPAPAVKAAAASPEVARRVRELEASRAPAAPAPAETWPTAGDIALRLLAQARGDALRLGHAHLSDWVPYKGEWIARCARCQLEARVRPRSWHGAPTSGPALELRCRPASTTP